MISIIQNCFESHYYFLLIQLLTAANARPKRTIPVEEMSVPYVAPAPAAAPTLTAATQSGRSITKVQDDKWHNRQLLVKFVHCNNTADIF